MKRKYYLVDTENVGDNWFGLLDKIRKKDRIVTFYTENHSKRLREFLLRQVNNAQIIWMECAVGNNALDYQLVGVLGYLIVKHPKASFCIYSNDKGYQKTAEFWESRGIHVTLKGSDQKKKAKKEEKRAEKKKDKKKGAQEKTGQDSPLDCKTCSSAAKHPGNNVTASTPEQPVNQSANNAPVSMSSQPAGSTSASPTKKKKKLSTQQYVTEIAKSVPASNLNGWYCALTHVLGQEAGRTQYEKIKESAQTREQLSKYCGGDRYSRGVHLTGLVLQANHLNADMGEKAYQIIQAYGTNELTKIKIELDKMIGQPSQHKNHYYNALRPVIALLHSL